MSLFEAYEGMGLPVFIVGLDSYEVLYINAAGKRFFGDVTGRKCYDFLCGGNRKCEDCIPAKTLEQLVDSHIKRMYQEEAGKYIEISENLLTLSDGTRGRLCVAVNITEQVRQEKEIEESRRVLRTIIDTLPAAIFWKDIDFRYLGANRQYADESGIGDPDMLIGKTDFDFFPKEVAERLYADEKEIFDTDRDMLYHEQPIDRGESWVSTSKVIMRDEKGEPFALLGIYDDITKAKQNERQLEKAILEAEEASRAKGEFLSRMSHEIRTPMNAIKGLAELLALTELSSVQDSYVRNIVKSSNLLLSIINDVLDFSKINENEIEFVEGSYLLADMVAGVVNVVSLRASEKDLTLLVDISPSLPKCLVGDEVRIKQVIINILNNAVKYTSEGYVVMRLSGERTQNGFELVCEIEDTGIGIRQDELPHLFVAFSQANRRVDNHIQGAGLGLSISDKLTRGMGGRITVESEFGKGSVFTVRFPQRVESDEPVAAVSDIEKKKVLLLESGSRTQAVAHMLNELGVPYKSVRESSDLLGIVGEGYTHCIYDSGFSDKLIRRMRGRAPGCVFVAIKEIKYAMGQTELCDYVLFLPVLITELANCLEMAAGQSEPGANSEKKIDDISLVDTKVLVVDDNEINLIVGGEILRAYQAEVTCANSGREAVELCEETRYDLIFMDHMMPEMDGIETTAAIREKSKLNRITPIIALTANVVSDMAGFYIKNGLDDFVSKPIDLAELRRILLQWLPEEKITAMGKPLKREVERKEKPAYSMERLVASLDHFGMYVSDVMNEIGNDYDLYVHRMDRIRTELAPLVTHLRELVRLEAWEEFAAEIDKMGNMIHDVGARECSARARKLAYAGAEGNAEYIRSDFFSLMDNMYMLEKKMEVAVHLAMGRLSPDVPFGDMGYCYDRLIDLKRALSEQDYNTCEALLDSLAHYSLDHTLDLILVAIGAGFAENNYAKALEKLNQALAYCEGQAAAAD